LNRSGFDGFILFLVGALLPNRSIGSCVSARAWAAPQWSVEVRSYRSEVRSGIDKTKPNRELALVMKKCSGTKARKKFDYPEETECDLLAARVRRRANRLTPEQRAEYLRRGMVRIDGGEWPKEATGPRH